jgi:hypothetical protein
MFHYSGQDHTITNKQPCRVVKEILA